MQCSLKQLSIGLQLFLKKSTLLVYRLHPDSLKKFAEIYIFLLATSWQAPPSEHFTQLQ